MNIRFIQDISFIQGLIDDEVNYFMLERLGEGSDLQEELQCVLKDSL